MSKLTNIEGIGEAYARKLGEVSITTREGLLEKGASPRGRKEIAEKTGTIPYETLARIHSGVPRIVVDS